MKRIGYLGPKGTFSQETLDANLSGEFEEDVAYHTIPEVLFAVQSGEIDAGLVPIENSIEGTVGVTLDTLAFETDLVIQHEVVSEVNHLLMARDAITREDISGIVSHPQPAGQCSKFLSRWFAGVPVIAANSTADAARIVAESPEPLAAIATRGAAELYSLEIIADDIADYPMNQTRFVVVGKEKVARTGRDRTSIVCFIRANHPGSLLEILQEFSSRSVNLSKIESRPTKKMLGEYYFFIDILGHVDDPEVTSAIGSLVGKLRELKLLGSYPRS